MVKVEALVVLSAPELVTREVTTPGTTVWTVLPGRVETASTAAPVAIEGALSDALLDTLEVPLGKDGLVSEDWLTKGTLASGSLGDAVRVGTAELASVVSSSCGKSVSVGKGGVVSAPELVATELGAPETSGESV